MKKLLALGMSIVLLSSLAWSEDLPTPPPDKGGSAVPVPPDASSGSDVSLPEISGANKKVLYRAKPKGFPWVETCLAGLGGGLIGGFYGFGNAFDSRGIINYNLLGPNVALYGGIGFGAGALVGFLLGLRSPAELEAINQSTLRIEPHGVQLAMNLKF